MNTSFTSTASALIVKACYKSTAILIVVCLNIKPSNVVNLDNCELVDEYLQSLERKDYNDEKAKELIKK